MLCGVADSSLLFFQQLAPFYMVTVCKMLCLHTGMRTAPLLCATLFSLQWLGKGKSVPLQDRGAQRVRGS